MQLGQEGFKKNILLYTYKWYIFLTYLTQKTRSTNWGFLIPYHYPLKRG